MSIITVCVWFFYGGGGGGGGGVSAICLSHKYLLIRDISGKDEEILQ